MLWSNFKHEKSDFKNIKITPKHVAHDTHEHAQKQRR